MKMKMLLCCSLAAAAVTMAGAVGDDNKLMDFPIAADATTYLDGTWKATGTATTSGPPPAPPSPAPGGGTTSTFTFALAEQATLDGCQIEGSPLYVRSGEPGNWSHTSATLLLNLAPGTITGVSFEYKYVTGYHGTVGANFSLEVANTAAYSSPLLNKYPYGHGAPYSPPVGVAVNGLSIAVPASGGAVAFKFHNLDKNIQIELPLQIKFTCAGSKPCFTGLAPLSISGNVPGDLITDLEAAGLIGDPLYELNFKNATLWDKYDWAYSTSFAMESSKLEALAATGGQHVLVFDGVKMGAHVTLNGKPVGTTTDQFLRYQFPLAAGALQAGNNKLTVTFDGSIDCDGRWMACTGGWDWAPYTTTKQQGVQTFSKGIWRSVYLAEISTVGIEHVVPQITYLGKYPTSPLVDGKHGGFKVDVRTHLWAPAATKGTLTLTTSWGKTASVAVTVPAGNTSHVVTVNAAASDIKLWWPAGHGAQPLYNVTVAFTSSSKVAQAAPVEATRRVGFRMFAIVTGDDADPAWIKNGTDGKDTGTGTLGMYWRINGAAILSKGANMIPMDELEGRWSAEAHYQLVLNAVAGGMNTLRVWGGGVFLPRAWYEACDQLGVMVYHDMQYAQQGHGPRQTPTQDAELRHNIRRLSNHPSIVMWDGCNECHVVIGTGTGIYATFVMTVVAQEDASRPVWPSCPASGWTGGVNPLTSIPNGKPLKTPTQGPRFEKHGPYTHGTGFPAVNGATAEQHFASQVPVTYRAGRSTGGISLPSTFASEFGASVFSSFESMSPTLDPKHWGIHGGMAPDNCPYGHDPNFCTGNNPMAERNYPCDSIIDVYFGKSDFDAVGADAFKKQLWQCMVGQALLIKQHIEVLRSENTLGIIVWQFNEIWPTGGWGSIEYGTVGYTKGQVQGGRWKPLQYWYQTTIFTDVMATCGSLYKPPHSPVCYVNNDLPVPFKGSVTITGIDFASGAEKKLKVMALDMPAGAGITQQFNLSSSVNGTTTMLHAVVTDASGKVVNDNYIPFTEPKNMLLPKGDVKFTISSAPNPDGSVDVTVVADKVAVYVTLTTTAQGRFSENAFVMTPGTRKLSFIPLPTGFDLAELAKTTRIEHAASYM
jgi:beta-galactosidase/beta-glucuronidase